MRTYTNAFFAGLLTGAINFDSHSFSLVLCTASPGTASGVTNAASIANSVHSEPITVTRSGSTISLVADSFVVADVAATPYVAIVDTTSNVVMWWDDGSTLNPNGGTVSLQATAGLLTVTGV